jgi:serine/threonine-protein kinase
MSIKLSDTQLALLGAASQREDQYLAPPTRPRLGPVKRAAGNLLAEGLVQEVRARKDAPVWRRDEDSDQALALKLTAAGLRAIARGADEQQETAGQTSSSDAGESESMPGGIDARDAGARVEAIRESAGPRVPRAGTKIRNVIEMLGQDSGATIDEIIATTGRLPLGLAGGEVTAKSDMYSFGLVLAEALLGRPIDMAGSQAEMIDKRRVIPDVSGIEPNMRPLLQAMLQPLAENRPASMAEVAAWEPAAPKASRTLKPPPPITDERSGIMPALAGASIAILSLGGAAYVFRDHLARWPGTVSAPTAPPGPAEEAMKSPATKLPPLTPRQPPPGVPSSGSQQGLNPPSPSAPNKNASDQTETVRIEPPSAAEPAGPPPRPVTAETLADALPPRAAQTNVDLPAATAGSAYRAELPTFFDPGGKGLRLTATGLPEGLILSDFGGGKGAIEGVPQHAGSASISIAAANQHDRTAQMSATLVVGEKSAPPAPVTKVEPPPSATSDKAAPVPAPRPSLANPPAASSPALAPPPPTIQAATPTPAEQTASQTMARIEAPPLQPPAPTPSAPAIAPATPEERAKAFIAKFDGGECFLVEPLPGATKLHEYQAVGREIEPFRRFDSAYKQDVGVEADLTLALITAAQCPALDLVRLAAPDGRQRPRLSLRDYEVGLGKPLLGTISNLEGRRLYLVLIDNDGLVHKLEAKVDAGGNSGTFNVPLTPNAGSVGPMQMLLAIVSDKPIPTFDTLRSANLKSIASRLVDDARQASASVEADYFKFVNR